MEGECAMKVFEMIGEGGKCTTACLRSLSRVEGFRLRMGRGVGAGEGFVGVENMSSCEGGDEGG